MHTTTLKVATSDSLG